MKVAALFVDPFGPYPGLVGPDLCWDFARDARTYSLDLPCVMHPPCGRWGKLAPINQKRWGTKIGDDGGLFAFALDVLRRVGGVIEHPAGSLAWDRFGLPKPRGEGWGTEGKSEFSSCEVWQSSYGHKCHKRTWLLYSGEAEPIPLDWRRDRSLATHQVGGGINTGHRSKPRLPQSEAHLTPQSFAEALVALASRSRHG